MLYDLFICHASEDKESLIRPLVDALRKENVEVWYDEFSLKIGDSIRRSLDKGLKQSRFGVVALSKAFFEKQWPQYELDGLAEREMTGKDKVILPIWHGVSHEDVMKYSLPLAGRKAVSSSEGIDKIVDEILSVVRPQHSPLIIARDTLLDWGLTPPVVTDEYWLRVAEASNRLPGFGAIIPEESTWDRWSFPLPHKEGGPEHWGERLAWTAMQMNWVKTADEIPITPLTPPQKVLDFINSHPGLFETCLSFPGLLAEYAPQLTIPGFGDDLEETFEKEYRRSCETAKQRRAEKSRSGSALTTNNKCPLCDEEWALRHPDFADYKPVYIAGAYFSGGMFGPRVSPYEGSDHAFWLLSSASFWLPEKVRSFLIEGMADHRVWQWGYIGIDKGGDWKSNGALSKALFDAIDGKPFKWTTRIKDDVLCRIKLAIETLQLPDSPEDILEHFLTYKFHEKSISEERKVRKRRQRKKRKVEK